MYRIYDESVLTSEPSMNVLQLDASILGDNSVSRALTQEIVESLRLGSAELKLTHLDLVADPVPVSDGRLLAARATAADARSADQQALVARADTAMAQLLAADLLVIGAPMYNFGIPSQLKAWIDLVSVAGVSFRYGPNGAEGMLTGKRAVIAATAGGQHAGQPSGLAHADYLKFLLNFLGLSDVRVVTAEGLAMGPAVREPALAAARAQIAALA
jgi:FMN-dependent NADH-azoreductase